MSDLERMLRLLMQSCAGLGWDAALFGVPRDEAVRDIVFSDAADRLLESVMPNIRAAASE